MLFWFIVLIFIMLWYFIEAAPNDNKLYGVAPLFIGIASALAFMLFSFGGIAFDELRRGTDFGWMLLALDAFAVWLIYLFVRMTIECLK